MGFHRLLEHTADMGIEASASSLEELFAEAAYALREVISAEAEATCRQDQLVEVTGGDYGELLVAWLNEILYLFEIKGFFPVDFEVEGVAADRLQGRVCGEPFSPLRHTIEREVKAVTYHQLLVEKLDGHWQARVYLDL